MSATPTSSVTVRYWAAARAAVGIESETVALPEGGVTIAELAAVVTARHTDLARVMQVASVLVDGRSIARADWPARLLTPGEVIEILPPFAGG